MEGFKEWQRARDLDWHELRESERARTVESTKMTAAITSLTTSMAELASVQKAQGIIMENNQNSLADLRRDFKWLGRIGMFFVPIFAGICTGIANIILPRLLQVATAVEHVSK